MSQLARLLSSISRPIAIICSDSADVAELAASFPNHQVVGAAELADANDRSLPRVDDDSIVISFLLLVVPANPRAVIVSALSCQGMRAYGCG
jgi:hypothetical protein